MTELPELLQPVLGGIVVRSQDDNAHEHLQGSMYTTPVLAIVGVGALSE